MSSYKVCLPRRACCCCALSTGGMLLGWLGGISYFANMIMGITTVTENIVIELPDDTPKSNAEFIDLVARVILVIDIIVSFVNLIGCVCLMIGTIKRMKSFIKPWLYGQILVLGTWTVVDLVIITLVMNKYSIVYLVALIVVTSGIIVILYLWICMFAFYKELRSDELLLKRSTTRETFKINQSFEM